MNESELERIMLAFATAQADILVATTRYRERARHPGNTIIINRADRHGLSGYCQLRG